MDFNQSAVGDALFSKTQQRVLGLLYGNPQQSFYLNEIVRLANMGKGTVARELERLCLAGLLKESKRGNQNHYQANESNPVFEEIKSITQKTFGVVDVLHSALHSLYPEIQMAFVYGSIARGGEHAASDLDVMVVSNTLTYTQIIERLLPAEESLGRKINPTLYSEKEFSDRLEKKQAFLIKVLQQQILWLTGEKFYLKKYASK